MIADFTKFKPAQLRMIMCFIDVFKTQFAAQKLYDYPQVTNLGVLSELDGSQIRAYFTKYIDDSEKVNAEFKFSFDIVASINKPSKRIHPDYGEVREFQLKVNISYSAVAGYLLSWKTLVKKPITGAATESLATTAGCGAGGNTTLSDILEAARLDSMAAAAAASDSQSSKIPLITKVVPSTIDPDAIGNVLIDSDFSIEVIPEFSSYNYTGTDIDTYVDITLNPIDPSVLGNSIGGQVVIAAPNMKFRDSTSGTVYNHTSLMMPVVDPVLIAGTFNGSSEMIIGNTIRINTTVTSPGVVDVLFVPEDGELLTYKKVYQRLEPYIRDLVNNFGNNYVLPYA